MNQCEFTIIPVTILCPDYTLSGKRRASCNWSKNGGQVQMSPGPVRRGRFSLEFDNPYYLCDRDGNLIGEGTLGGDGNR